VISGYIARMKKEKQDRLAHESHPSHGYSSYASGVPTPPFHNTARGGYAGNYNSYPHPTVGAPRGAYSHGRGGPSAYHPYQRPPPPHAAHKFRNKSVTFNKQDPFGETSGDGQKSALTTNSAHLGQGYQHQSQPKTLCPAFTLTGIQRDDNLPPLLLTPHV
jgi:hypothetical protein